MDYTGLHKCQFCRAKEREKKCPDLASGHHRIMEPRKWGTRDDGFKQGQFRGVLLDSQHSSSSCAGVRCRWRIVGVVAVDMEIKKKRRTPGEKIPPFLYSAASGPPFAAVPHRPTRLGLGRGEGPAEVEQNPANSDHSQQGARCGWALGPEEGDPPVARVGCGSMGMSHEWLAAQRFQVVFFTIEL